MTATWIAGLLLAATPILAWAGQNSPGSLTVVVVDPDGAFIPHAHVEVYASPDNVAQQTQADEHGVAVLHLPAGIYTITVIAPGFVWGEKNVDVRDGSNQYLRVELNIGRNGSPVAIIEIKPPVYVETSPLPLIPAHKLSLMRLAAKRAQ
ncbi:MAG TPA: carboxypeptidase-like regulatory domain-containing protein [Terracidiphilus sp.]